MGKVSKLGRVVKDKGSQTVAQAKKGGGAIAEKAKEKKREMDFLRLKPVFKDDLSAPNLDEDKNKDHPIMEGAIGRIEKAKGSRILVIYTPYTELLGVDFYPKAVDGDVFFANKYHHNKYVDLNSFFDYEKREKVSELEHIAQSLGATEFEIRMYYEHKVYVGENSKGKVGSKKRKIPANAEFNQEKKSKSYEKSDLVSHLTFKGNEPTIPELHYFKNDPSINSLINSRMHKDNPIGEQTVSLKYSDSSSININNAGKIDVALKQLKIGTNLTIKHQAVEESTWHIGYKIVFPD